MTWSSFRDKRWRADAGRFHVAGLARRAVRGDDHQRAGGSQQSHREVAEQLVRRQFQGLSIPPGVLSHAWNPGLVQPRHRPLQALPGADDPRYVQTDARLESGRQVPGVRPGRGRIPTRGGQAGGLRQRSERNSRSSTTSTGSPSMAAKAASRSPSRARRATA